MNRFEAIKHNLPYGLFIALSLKLLVLSSASLFEVLVLLVVGLMVGFFELNVKSSKFIEISNKINDLEAKNLKKDDEIKELRKMIESIRAVQGFKSVSRG